MTNDNAIAILRGEAKQLRERVARLPVDHRNVLLDAAKWIENGADELEQKAAERERMN